MPDYDGNESSDDYSTSDDGGRQPQNRLTVRYEDFGRNNKKRRSRGRNNAPPRHKHMYTDDQGNVWSAYSTDEEDNDHNHHHHHHHGPPPQGGVPHVSCGRHCSRRLVVCIDG
jgi:hypothetical protein